MASHSQLSRTYSAPTYLHSKIKKAFILAAHFTFMKSFEEYQIEYITFSLMSLVTSNFKHRKWIIKPWSLLTPGKCFVFLFFLFFFFSFEVFYSSLKLATFPPMNHRSNWEEIQYLRYRQTEPLIDMLFPQGNIYQFSSPDIKQKC